MSSTEHLTTDAETRARTAEDRINGTARTVPDLLRDLISQLSDLFRKEIALAKAEASEAGNRISGAMITLASGLLLALAALITLMDAAVYGLAQNMPLWIAAVIVGGIIALVALVLVTRGQKMLSAQSLAPTRTIRSVQEDAKLVKDKI